MIVGGLYLTFGAAVGTGGRESSEIAKKGEVNLQVRLQLLGRLACDAALVRACEGRGRRGRRRWRLRASRRNLYEPALASFDVHVDPAVHRVRTDDLGARSRSRLRFRKRQRCLVAPALLNVISSRRGDHAPLPWEVFRLRIWRQQRRLSWPLYESRRVRRRHRHTPPVHASTMHRIDMQRERVLDAASGFRL